MSQADGAHSPGAHSSRLLSAGAEPARPEPEGRLAGARTFVGFGFGAIQAGLFLYEAWRSGNFGRLVVAEVAPDAVSALRAAHGVYTLNIAHAAGVEQVTVGPVEVYNPAVEADRAALIEAVADADEIATAVPSVQYYVSEGPGSIHRLLAAGLLRKAERDGLPVLIYAAENHNHAAEILLEQVTRALQQERTTEIGRAAILSLVSIVNTVIGKMSGVIDAAVGLAPMTPNSGRAFLVEEFNRILITRVRFPEYAPEEVDEDGVALESLPAAPVYFERGIQVFAEKEDLLPFEEAKLYGHNAMHALAGYMGAQAGVVTMDQIGSVPGLLPFVRAAVLEEAGAALIRKHAALGDPLFTETGFAAFTDDLIGRMANPHLQDAVARVGRDPARKLGWDDRLVGTMRLALAHGIVPHRFALGAASALRQLHSSESYPEGALDVLWRRPPQDGETVRRLRDLIRDGWALLHEWKAAGCPNVQDFTTRWL